tara:strand:- start:23719 stop:23991 length:273 start_codon:yes stop_codon:yes gene_type:complete
MLRAVRKHSLYGGWKPNAWAIDTHAPFHDWLLILRHGRSCTPGIAGRLLWSELVLPFNAGASIGTLMRITEANGLCGMVIEDRIRKAENS